MDVKLLEILNYYKDTYEVEESIDDVYNELIENNVEVKGDSFFCPIEKDGIIVLLAGTKDNADLWVMKKILKLIKTKVPIISLLNGNSEYLLKQLEKYNVNIIRRHRDTSVISFNMEKG